MSLSAQLPDFDTMMALYERYPAEFEAYRRQLLLDCVSEAPTEFRPQLMHTLFLIEQGRENANSPLESAEVAFKLMAKSSDQLQSALSQLRHETSTLEMQTLLKN